LKYFPSQVWQGSVVRKETPWTVQAWKWQGTWTPAALEWSAAPESQKIPSSECVSVWSS